MSFMYDKEDKQLEQLKDILLNGTQQDIDDIRILLNNEEKLAKKIDPILEKHVEVIRADFDNTYGKEVESIVVHTLENSPELLLKVISPMLGRLIKKYIGQQFQILRESIDQSVKKATSFGSIKSTIKEKLFGVKASDEYIAEFDKAQIAEVYLIERNSGILMGSFSRQNTIDRDMIGGMLTAIKGFVEDAINKGNESEDLEMIEYGNHKILIQNFYTYYVAVVISGTISASNRSELSDKILEFADKELSIISQSEINSKTSHISDKLEDWFK